MRANDVSSPSDGRTTTTSGRHPLSLALLLCVGWLLAACSGGSPDAGLGLRMTAASEAGEAESRALDGSVVAGAITLEVQDGGRLSSVDFHVDDPERRQAPSMVAEARPFRVELDTTELPDGEHSVTVTGAVASGLPPIATHRFRVANGAAGVDDAEAAGDAPGDGVARSDVPRGEGTGGTGTEGEGAEIERSQGEGAGADATDDGGAEPEEVGGDGDVSGEGQDDGGDVERGTEGSDASGEPETGDDGSPTEDGTGDGGDDGEASAPGHVGGGDLPAPTLFVSPNGDDGNDGRSASSPLRSVRRAASVVRPGDVVYLRGGVYPIGVEFRTSGTSSSPIVWASYPGERAVFDGSDQTPGSSVAKFHVHGASWNVFLNLEVRNAPQEGIYVEAGHDNVFRGIVTHGNQFSGIGNVRGDRNLYEDIVTYDNYDDRSGGQHADGIAISSGDGNTIRRVATFDNSDDGIDVWKSTNTRIEYVASYRNGRGGSGEGNGIKAGGDYGWNGTVVRYTLSFDNQGNGFNENNGQGILFENSTAYRNGGWDFMGGPSTTRRNNLAPSSSSGMWGSPDDRNSWNLGVEPRFESESFGSSGFLVPTRDGGAAGAGAGGADLGAIPVGGSFRGLVGEVVFGLLPSR